jgi:hypothetical protein
MNAIRALVLKKTIKYPFRNGKPTRKMQRFLRLSYKNPTMEEVYELEKVLFGSGSKK